MTVDLVRAGGPAGQIYKGAVHLQDGPTGRTLHAVVVQSRIEEPAIWEVHIRAAAIDISRLPWWTGTIDVGITDGEPSGAPDHISIAGGPPQSALDADVSAGDLAIEREGYERTGVPGTQVKMDFERGAFYDAPFPSDDLQKDDGSIPLDGFPNPGGNFFVSQTLAELRKGANGFGVSSGIFLETTAAVDTQQLPDIHSSVAPNSPVFLIGVDPEAKDFLRRYPVDTHFESDAGPFGARNLLSLLPLQGVPLREGTRYAAVVLRDLRDASGNEMGVSESLVKIREGVRPAGLANRSFVRYREALSSLEEAGVAPGRVAGLAVFSTGTPTRELMTFRDAVLQRPLPQLDHALQRKEVFDDYCVYESSIAMPVYQGGRPPFFAGGGAWQKDADGNPVLQSEETANFVLTVPRKPVPEAGFPLVVFSRTGGGGERPLVDRGPRATHGGPSIQAGAGPAQEFARAGFAGVSVDGPHGGRRNITGLDEQLLMFNFLNPAAMRDNVRQSALELVLLAHVMGQLTVDARDCPGVEADEPSAVSFDLGRLALMGHSMGATIAQPVLAAEPLYRAAILSGAGASWLENIVHKQSPLEVKPVAEWILLYPLLHRALHEYDPVLSLVQWAGEASDGPAYNRLLGERGPEVVEPHILMLQGIVDTYILPPIANATSLSLGLDLAGAELDGTNPALAGFRPLDDVFSLADGKQLPLPAAGNKDDHGRRRTAVVVQHPEDGIEDGHEVVFQTDAPKRQYRCFLETFAAGTPSVCP